MGPAELAASAPLPVDTLPVDTLPAEGDLDEDAAADPEDDTGTHAGAAASLLDELFPSSEAPETWDLGAAGAGATAAGLGLDHGVSDRTPRPAAHVAVGVPPDEPAPDDPRPAPPRPFGLGSYVAIALSLGLIAAAAFWPRIGGAPPAPARPAAGGGSFGDTLGDAAQAAFRDSVARRAAPADSLSAASPTADSAAAPGAEYQPVPLVPDAAPPSPPAAAAPPPGRRTLGVAPPAGTAILPPRVAGLSDAQTAALASRETVSPGSGTTWVVLSSPGRAEAEALATRYRQSGYRVGVIASTAAGRTTYRVGVGQFASREAAAAARDRLPPQAPADTWPLDLSAQGLSR